MNTAAARILEPVAALALVGWAAVLVADWTDRGDATCTSLYRVDRAGHWFRGDCAGVMGPRLAVVAVLLLVAVGLAVDAARRARS